MSWRDRMVKPSAFGDDGRPTLEAVLDLYNIDYTSKVSSMVHCPLHEDNTSSCSVNFDKQVWHCHSCSGKGDVWKLIMMKEDCDYERAREFATTSLGFTQGSAGGGDKQLRGLARDKRPGSRVPARSRADRRDGAYKPSWRGGDT